MIQRTTFFKTWIVALLQSLTEYLVKKWGICLPSPPKKKTPPAYLALILFLNFSCISECGWATSNGPDSLCRACLSFMAGLGGPTASPSDGTLGGWVLGYYADVGKGQHHPIQWSNSEYESLQQNSSRSNFQSESRRYFEGSFSESLARPGKFLCAQPILCSRWVQCTLSWTSC